MRHCSDCSTLLHLRLQLLVSCVSAATTVTTTRVGDAWGTNIHWTAESAPGEAAMMKAFKLAPRMDLLLAVMKAHGICPYWILATRSMKNDDDDRFGTFVELEPPVLVGSSQNGSTHFWVCRP